MRRIHPLIRDFGITALTQGSVFGASLLVVGIIGRILGAEQLAEYLMLRRVLTWLMSGTLLGFGVALPRYVAMSLKGSNGCAHSYFLAAFLILTSLSVGIVIALNGWASKFALLLFGSASLRPLVFPLSLAVLTWTVQAVIYGYYRGKLEMFSANGLQILNMALAPALVVTLLRKRSVVEIMTTLALVNLCTCLLFAVPIILQINRRAFLEIFGPARNLLWYGLPRVLGDFASSAPSAIAPIIAVRFMSLREVSPLLLGMSIMTAVSLSVSPIGLVLLSKISMMVAAGEKQEIRKHVEILEATIVQVSTFACLQVCVFADVIVRTWIGKDFWQDLVVIRIIIGAMPFYLYWVALRSTVDAVAVHAYDAWNNAVAFLVFLAVTAILIAFPLNKESILASIGLGLAVATVALSMLTARTVRKLYGTRSKLKDSLLPLALAGCLGAVSVVVHMVYQLLQSLPAAMAFSAALGAIFVWGLWTNGSGWISHLLKMAFPVKQAA